MSNIININVSTPNDGLGDTLRASQIKANENFAELNSKKVEKIAGKDLSTNDFTSVLQTKLNGIEAGAEVNVQSDWNQEDDLADDFIKNKPVGQFLQAFGTLHYSNSLTAQNATANVELKLLNNILGPYTNLTNAPFGVGTIWNSTTNRFDFSSLKVGDYVELRPDLDIDLVGTNTSFSIYMKMAIGGVNPWQLNVHNAERKSTDLFNEAPYIGFDISNEDTRDFPAEIYIKTDANATVKVNGWLIAITRKSVNIIDIAIDESNLVHKTGAETIQDIKTFVDPIRLNPQATGDFGTMEIDGDEFNFKLASQLSPLKAKAGVLSLRTISNNLIRFLFSGNGRDYTLPATGGTLALESYVDNNSVKLTTNQTIDGVKTFVQSPIVPTATTANQAVNFGQMTFGNAVGNGNVSNRGIEIYETDGTGVNGYSVNNVGIGANSENDVASVFNIGASNTNNITQFRKGGNVQAAITHEGKIIGADATEPNQMVTLGQLNDVYIPLSGTTQPITGDLEFGNNKGLRSIILDEDIGLYTNNSIVFSALGMFLNSTNLNTLEGTSIQLAPNFIEINTYQSDFQFRGSFEFPNNGSDRKIYPQTGWVQDAITASAETTTSILNKIGNGTLIDQLYLPSYVDDVLEFANLASFPVTGAVGKIYIAIDTSKQYRWTGSVYLQITNGLIASTNDVPDSTNKRYQTDNQRSFNDATSSIQTQINAKANTAGQVFTGTISAPNLSGTNTGDQNENNVYLSHDFLSAISSEDFAITAVNGGSFGAGTPTINNVGVHRITSSTSANSGVGIRSSSLLLRLKGGEVFTYIFNPLTFTNTTNRMGIHDSTSSAVPANGVFFRYSGDGLLTLVTADNSVQTTSATIATLTTNTWYKVRFTVNANATSVLGELFNASGTLIASVTQTTNIPTTARALNVCAITTNSGTTATALLDVDFISLKTTLTR